MARAVDEQRGLALSNLVIRGVADTVSQVDARDLDEKHRQVSAGWFRRVAVQLTQKPTISLKLDTAGLVSTALVDGRVSDHF